MFIYKTLMSRNDVGYVGFLALFYIYILNLKFFLKLNEYFLYIEKIVKNPTYPTSFWDINLNGIELKK